MSAVFVLPSRTEPSSRHFAGPSPGLSPQSILDCCFHLSHLVVLDDRSKYARQLGEGAPAQQPGLLEPLHVGQIAQALEAKFPQEKSTADDFGNALCYYALGSEAVKARMSP